MKTSLDHARECGATFAPSAPRLASAVIFTHAQLDAFAERIRLDERERCALVAESMQHAELCTPVNVADAIRKAAP